MEVETVKNATIQFANKTECKLYRFGVNWLVARYRKH